MISSIELQVICKILTSEIAGEVDKLCSYDSSFYAIFPEQIEYILSHRDKYGDVPDIFTFQAQFPDFTMVTVTEPVEYLVKEICKNKSIIVLRETFNKLKDLGTGDVSAAWEFLSQQCDIAASLQETQMLDLVKDAQLRSDKVIEFNQQSRIPTGFAEIDKLMYGGLSTVEELLLIVARTNSGKSWVCTRMMESAHANGFPVLYYSPEMQGAFLGTRFDTWKAHFRNDQLFQGKYDDAYIEYIKTLTTNDVSAYILEDKDVSEGAVTTNVLKTLVKQHGIKLLIIDGLSYMSDVRKSDTDYVKYKNICMDLFKLSKQFGCAVVVAMQANRETKDMKDDKGDPFPNLYNIEGSDHPARIATQAFALRQVFDKHVLDIRMEKSRNANNQKPILSYAWDVNTGNAQYLPSEDDITETTSYSDIHVDVNSVVHINNSSDDSDGILSEDFKEDVEF